MRCIIIGGDSNLGTALRERLTAGGHSVLYTSRRTSAACHLDLSEDPSGWGVPGEFDAAYLFAAVCSMDAVEEQPESTRLINVEHTVRVAAKLVKAGCRVIFPSTSQVFDGTVPMPDGDTPTSPTSEYGRQKAEAERQLLAMGDSVAVIRYTKILQPGYPLFAKWRSSLRAGDEITPFSDLYFAPVSMDHAMEATMAVAESGKGGVWHVSAGEDLSYADAARIIAGHLKVDPELVRPVTIAESGAVIPAAPSHAALDAGRLKAELGLAPQSVTETILGAL